MARNSEYLQANPVRLDISRSKFHQSPRWTGTFNAGELVPIYLNTDILPGSTMKVSVASAVRMTTPIRPVMDDLFMDVSFYWVPHELILSRSYMSPSTSDSNHSWKAFIGAQDSQLNMPVPAGNIRLPSLSVSVGPSPLLDRLPNYFGLGVLAASNGSYAINCLGTLAFMAVWNENYREPNSQTPGVFSIAANTVSITWEASTGDTSGHSTLNDFSLPNVCRLHSLFGSCLPWPQRNTVGVTIPMDDVPVYSGSLIDNSLHKSGIKFYNRDGNFNAGVKIFPGWNQSTGSSIGDEVGGYAISSADNYQGHVAPANLWADLSKANLYVNVLRSAVQAQRWYEALARGGNRIDELTASMFGVVPKDAGQNRPEYLGGKRIPVNMTQVNNTASAVGETGAFSLTNDADYYFTKSFDKWGSVIGVGCVRFRDSFCNRIPRQFKRFDRFDFYWPQFANLGEEAIYKQEVDIDGLPITSYANASLDGVVPGTGVAKVFGFQEYAAEYRYPSDIVCGHAAPYGTMGYWTYANHFNSEINLADFLAGRDIKANVDRTLQTPSSVAGFQFLGQFQFEIDVVLPMPTHSIPGLVDHH